MYKYTRYRGDDILETCVCLCLVLQNNIFILLVSFALLPLSILVFALFPSFPFAVVGYLLSFLRCL
jgi:hypothetical protein